MNDQEKSVQFLKLLGMRVMKSGYGDPELWRDNSGKLHAINLYHSENMALAWRVHLWMVKRESVNDPAQRFTKPLPYIDWFIRYGCWFEDDAQRLWLDKIFELCVDAGLIEVNKGIS